MTMGQFGSSPGLSLDMRRTLLKAGVNPVVTEFFLQVFLPENVNPSVTLQRQTLGSRVTKVVTFRLWTVILTPREVVEING